MKNIFNQHSFSNYFFLTVTATLHLFPKTFRSLKLYRDFKGMMQQRNLGTCNICSNVSFIRVINKLLLIQWLAFLIFNTNAVVFIFTTVVFYFKRIRSVLESWCACYLTELVNRWRETYTYRSCASIVSENTMDQFQWNFQFHLYSHALKIETSKTKKCPSLILIDGLSRCNSQEHLLCSIPIATMTKIPKKEKGDIPDVCS